MRILWVIAVAGCAVAAGGHDGRSRGTTGDGGFTTNRDGGIGTLGGGDGAILGNRDGGILGFDRDLGRDLANSPDLVAAADLSGAPDLLPPPDLTPVSTPSVVTGGPCASGATGATAIRVRWVDAGGQADAQIDKFGLPDSSVESVSVAGTQIGFEPVFDDPYLGDGGLVLDDSDFIVLQLSTVGVASLRSATLAIRGRSFNTTASGSFAWQSFSGIGETPDDFVSNVAPYQWYRADLGGAIQADGSLYMHVYAGPSSDSLIVNQLEICLDAQ